MEPAFAHGGVFIPLCNMKLCAAAVGPVSASVLAALWLLCRTAWCSADPAGNSSMSVLLEQDAEFK